MLSKLKSSLFYPFYSYRLLNANYRLLPSFLIIGAQKAGTTSLFRYILSNPYVLKPLKKEVHYFDEFFDKSFRWYRSHFPASNDRRYITGEGSTSYLFCPHAPERVKYYLPDVKLIVLLRNPVERAFSHYKHELRNGNEHFSFLEALKNEKTRAGPEYKKMIEDANYYSPTARIFSYVAKGKYALQLQKWLKFFPKESFLFINSERMFDFPPSVLERVANFLEIPNDFKADFKVHNKGADYPEMSKESRASLTKAFAQSNRELYDLVGEEYNW